jgi:hypothetical protein
MDKQQINEENQIMSENNCEYCNEDFSSKEERLEHELENHEEEMSGHDKNGKKRSLNKLKEKKKTKKHNRKQKIKYGGIAAVLGVLVIGGGFLAAQNIDSSRPVTNSSIGVGEPVHWHANYQISVCGENRVPQDGPMLAHTHGETRFHLEGVRRNKEQATLGWVLDQLGTEFTEDSIYGQTSCNGEPANLTVQANGETLENPEEYIIRDGDNIRIELS